MTQDVFEIIHSTRAMRRLKSDPVPDDLIEKVLSAGLAAANGGNRRLLAAPDRSADAQFPVHHSVLAGQRYSHGRRRQP